MKKVIIYIIGVVALLVIADMALGVCCKYYIKNHQLSGRYLPLDRLIKEVDEDMILIGNSAILNSLDPQVIEDSLAMSCYNGGIHGQGFAFFETILDCILQRHTPKAIVLGLRPEETGANAGEGIYDVLKPYYDMGYQSIDDHYNATEGFDRLLLHSNLIRYNTIWVRVLLYMLFDKTDYQGNGFQPKDVPTALPKLMHVNKVENPVESKMKCLERIIRKCKSRNITFSVCFPPNYLVFDQDAIHHKTIPCVKAVSNLCEREGVSCFVDYNNEEFLGRPDLFYDNGHVNKNGADRYSRMFASRLKHLHNGFRHP